MHEDEYLAYLMDMAQVAGTDPVRVSLPRHEFSGTYRCIVPDVNTQHVTLSEHPCGAEGMSQ
jgi:hypothetical protein